MTREIPLTKGAVSIVDDEDFSLVSQYRWKLSTHDYAVRSIYLGTFDGIAKYSSQTMHRLIMNNPKGMMIDHINGNRLDNSKANLRVCTTGQNQMNSPKCRKSVSKYKGVTYCKRDNAWIAQVRSGSKTVFRKNFRNEIEAALAYNGAAKLHHGEFASLNDIK